ncbi:Nucleotid_trans domain-containing protein [Caenorhabditis elegans]|uniref:Nucleotid_trans domain-containing protein n=1 Tax=Caenorhabditis elegans TaxID=6239 RepID=Q9TXY5_CAEEL|nr:Nucleotid_trans domain-containing protein [Caenorhabditis elegans]CCD70103.1 Nucleotid_trans domain-containing protein [Caenorhabditis elegans]|eukprot:NP_493823.1 Uncharacterized protein CELE_F46F5.10 [Caenorhabditis elegans]
MRFSWTRVILAVNFLVFVWMLYKSIEYPVPAHYSKSNVLRENAYFNKKSRTIRIESSCECVSNQTNKSYDFCYRNPRNESLVGKRFNCDWLSTLEDMKLVDAPDQEMVDMSNPSRNESDVIFVSAISSNHIGNFNQMNKLLIQHFPHQKVLLYSLDLSDNELETLDKNVIIRKFNYAKYPNYVRNLKEYRFKALILAEVISEYSNVWWLDAHNRWLQPKPLSYMYEEMAQCYNNDDCKKNSSIFMFLNSTHSNYAVLNYGLLDYFPTYDLNELKTNEAGLQLSAMFVYLARTPFTLEVLKWHTLCALEDKCMNPPKAKLECKTIPSWDIYAECFRYDQSSINLIMFNFFRNHNHYFMDAGSLTRTYEHY